jgi:hypothetical protein
MIISSFVFIFLNRRYICLGFALLAVNLTSGCSTLSNDNKVKPVVETSSFPQALTKQPLQALNSDAPVYRNPTIAVVELRSHIDEQGRLLGPQLMYQVTDPGGWNLEVVDKQGGRIINSSAIKASQQQASNEGIETILPKNMLSAVIFTGCMQYDEKPQADIFRLAHDPTFSLIYDPKAGWLLIPPL